MSDYESQQFKSFYKGVNASTDRYNQPQGSVPRLSNLLLTKRGSFVTCDGTQILHAFNGVPTANRGRVMASKLFAPTGVPRYYLALIKSLDLPLGPPQNLVLADAGGGGTLGAGTYFYTVTAIDGVTGETFGATEANITILANHKITLTWNVIPNAVGYRVYRGAGAGAEVLITGTGLPVSQVPAGTLTVTYTDDGSASASVYNVTSARVSLVLPQPPGTTEIVYATFTVPSTSGLSVGMTFAYVPGTNNGFALTWKIIGIIDSANFTASHGPTAPTGLKAGFTTTGGTFNAGVQVPGQDTTQQVALVKMPVIAGSSATLPVAYTNSNIVALFPADPIFVDGGGGGGVGGGGRGGGGGTGGGSGGGSGAGTTSTPSGGIPGNTSFTPEMVQFSNRMILALGNGFPGQIYSDPSTPTNPATISNITAISVDAFGVVTVTTGSNHGIPVAAVGANVLLANILNAVYNGLFVTISVPDTTHFKVVNLNAVAQPASSGGTSTTTTLPWISTFTQAFPIWATGVTYLSGDLITPTISNGHYYKCTQGGISGGAQPTFPVATGAQVAEASPSKVVWQEAGLISSTSPPPPGAGHIKVYAGSLWAWNTSSSNTANGLDGPTALRMSDSNNPNSWNPVNQAFIDKDDGTEGFGLAAFTIAGFGIPPEGSLVCFKQQAGYQIVGVFGSPSFLIQRIKSSLGCTAPRTIQFATGYGLIRFTALGFAVYDGMNDRIVDEDIHNYIFPSDEADTADITKIDFNWVAVSWASQTALPAMYVAALPIGDSNGRLTRIFCYDLVLKAWAIVDLPFAISTITQDFSNTAIPVTVLGTYNDGCLHRWQAADPQWDNSIDSPGPSDVLWSVETPMTFNKRSQGARLYCRQVVTSGRLTLPTATVGASIKLQGEPTIAAYSRLYLGLDNSFVNSTAVDEKVLNLDLVLSGTGPVEINNFDFQVKMESTTVPPRLT